MPFDISRAMERRTGIYGSGTSAVRILDGPGDDAGSMELEDYAGRWLVQTRDEEELPPKLLDAAEACGARALYWKQLGDQKGAPAWVMGERLNEPFPVTENGMKLWIDFAAGYSQGLFLDQRDNRREVRELCAASGRKLQVLNCFAYTCGFGLAAALGGAETLNVDLSKKFLEWGRRNYELNGINPGDSHGFLYGDALNWMERLARKGRQFDLVVLDPPTFSRDKEGKVFRIEEGMARLVAAAERVLTPGGRIFCSTNLRALTRWDFQGMILEGLQKPEEWNLEERGMPGDFTGEQYLKACWAARR